MVSGLDGSRWVAGSDEDEKGAAASRLGEAMVLVRAATMGG